MVFLRKPCPQTFDRNFLDDGFDEQRVHAAVHEADWSGCAQRLTVSVGVAVAQAPEEGSEAVLERADQALYRAKSDGRDRVVVAEPRGLALA